MLSWLAKLITGGVLDKALDAWKARMASVDHRDEQAVALAIKEFEAQIDARRQVTEMRKAEGQWGPIGILMFGFGMIVMIYTGKVVLWDNVILAGEGSTPVIRGEVADWMMIIIQWLFGVGGGLQAVRIVASRFGK